MTKKENYHGLSNEELLIIQILIKGLREVINEEAVDLDKFTWIKDLINLSEKLDLISNLLLEIENYKEYYKKINIKFLN